MNLRINDKEWTEARVQTLLRMWAEGMSCSQIGAELSVTRNSVAGKIHRLGAPKRETYEKPKAPRIKCQKLSEPRPMARIHRPPEPTREIDDTAIPYEQRKHFLELGNNHCRWRIETGESGFWCNEKPYCGGETDGGSYCRGHRAIMYHIGSPRPPKREQPIREWQARPVQEPAIQALGS